MGVHIIEESLLLRVWRGSVQNAKSSHQADVGGMISMMIGMVQLNILERRRR